MTMKPRRRTLSIRTGGASMSGDDVIRLPEARFVISRTYMIIHRSRSEVRLGLCARRDQSGGLLRRRAQWRVLPVYGRRWGAPVRDAGPGNTDCTAAIFFLHIYTQIFFHTFYIRFHGDSPFLMKPRCGFFRYPLMFQSFYDVQHCRIFFCERIKHNYILCI